MARVSLPFLLRSSEIRLTRDVAQAYLVCQYFRTSRIVAPIWSAQAWPAVKKADRFLRLSAPGNVGSADLSTYIENVQAPG